MTWWSDTARRTLSRTYVNKYGGGKSSVKRGKMEGRRNDWGKGRGQRLCGEKNAALLLETLLCFSRFQMHYISKTSEDFFLQDWKKNVCGADAWCARTQWSLLLFEMGHRQHISMYLPLNYWWLSKWTLKMCELLWVLLLNCPLKVWLKPAFSAFNAIQKP